MNDLMTWLFAQYQDYTPTLIFLELLAAVLGLISVLLSKRGNIWVFPVGLCSTALYVYLLWKWQLFGDMLINAYYSAMSIYGWVNWSQHSAAHKVQIETTSAREWGKLAAIGLASFVFVGAVYYVKPWINNDFSMENVQLGFAHFVWTDWTDMFTTGLFLIGMLLMAKRKIENWLVWIVADAISVPLYFYKGLMFTSVQYLLFTMVAVLGYMSWKKMLAVQAA
ncbi:nicotinamide riboside transporter PnuC [Neisseriaceae bacterium B1]